MRKALLIGCGILALMGIGAVVLLIVTVPKLVNRAQQFVAAEQARQALVSSWRAPAGDAPADKVFPPAIGAATRSRDDEEAAIPELNFDQPGRHATYRAAGDEIDVYVLQASALEKEALFGRVQQINAQQKNKGGYNMIVNLPYRCYYSSSRHGQNHLWYADGRVLVFRWDSSVDHEPFIHEYFRATSAAAPTTP